MKILKTIKAIFASIQTVDDYLEEKRVRRAAQDKRITELFRATVNGESGWFLDFVKQNSDCAAEIIQECKFDDESTK